jgi:FkbM family methyltransferase
MRSIIKANLKRWLYGSCPGYSGSFPYYGVRTFFPRHSIVFALACDQGIYEASNIRLLQSALRPNTTAFDVGANIGLMSIPLLHLEPSLTVVSLEPSPHNCESLFRTHAASSFKGRWEVLELGLSDYDGESTFQCASPDLGAFDGFFDTGRAGKMTPINVKVTTLDRIWEMRGRPAVSAIKIDVEGSELSVLRGAYECLRSSRPVVLTEWCAPNLKRINCPPEGLLTLATELDYEVCAMPTLVKAVSAVHLRSLMEFGESFALLPH